MIKNYFKTAWRSLWKNKITTVINITGLAVGMSAAVLILLWVQNEINFDNYYKGANNIYRLTTNLKAQGWIWETTPLLLANTVKQELPEIEKTTKLYTNEQPVFNINNNLSYARKCAYIDNNWFSIFHYDFIEGNAVSFAQDLNGVILTVSEAKKYFGNSGAMGKTIRIGKENFVVKGIVKDAPPNSSFQYTSFIPLENLLKDADRKANDEQWGNANYITFIQVKPGVTPQNLSEKITNIVQQKSGDVKKEATISLVSIKDMHFETGLQASSFVTGNKNTVYIFTIIGVFLLLIACINYVNLTTAQASLRAKEVSVRKIVGANKFQLFYQFLTEALLVSCFAVIVTLVLIQLSLPAFNSITNKNFQQLLTSSALWEVIGITLFAAFVLNSIYPALVLSSFKPLNVFKGFTVLKLKDSYLRKGLVTLQFTISIILIVGAIVIYKQMQFIQQTNPGYNRSQVLVSPLPLKGSFSSKKDLANAIKQDLLSQSFVQNVSLSNQVITDIGSYSTGNADWDGRDSSVNPKIAQLSTDADFANTMQLQMKEGRWFDKSNEADKNNVVVNEEAIKELNIHQPSIGQRFRWKGNTGQIIGIVKDFKFKSMHEKTSPLVAFQNPNWYNTFTVRIAPGNTENAIKVLQNVWRKFSPDKPLEYKFLDDTFNDLYAADQQASILILVFGVIAIFISCLGLFGLATFAAEQRSKEIGIRKVLGASVTSIVRLISTDFIKLVFIAILIAVPVSSWAMNKWLEDFTYKINLSWWVFTLAGMLASVIALFTISFQAIKAALANPVKSLRSE